MRLRDLPCPWLTWRDLLVVVRCAPPDSPLARVLDPAVQAQVDTQLLRSMEYSLRWLAWAKTRDGENGRNRPGMVEFPWESPDDGDAVKGDPMTLEETADWLGWTAAIVDENRRRRDAGLPQIST